VCLQNLPVTFAMDRAGLVGADGPTHHGLYDMAYLRCMPNLILMAPKDENELRQMLLTAVYSNRPAALRYPRGAATGVAMLEPVAALPIGKGELLREGDQLLLVAIGTMVATAEALAGTLQADGIACAVINARFIKPLDRELISHWARATRKVVALEEGCAPGGFSSAVAELLADERILRPLLRCAMPDHLVQHGDQARLMDEEGLSPEALLRRIRAFAAEA
jgi:1-deoxy-D-xylulose-5-phosphate synthase